MTGAMIAEANKLLRHRALFGLVWIFPLGLVAIFVLGELMRMSHGVGGPPRLPLPPPTADRWIQGSAVIWKVAASAPGRFLIGGFAALAVGGEYGWNTWKLVVPHQKRWVLILAKYAVVILALAATLVLTDLLAVALNRLAAELPGAKPIPDGITLAALVGAHVRLAASAAVSGVFTVGVAATAAVAMRSTLGGALAAVAVTALLGVLLLFAPLIDRWILFGLPAYHLNNVQAWITGGAPFPLFHPVGVITLDWPTSAAVLGAWTAALLALPVLLFQRQDLN